MGRRRKALPQPNTETNLAEANVRKLLSGQVSHTRQSRVALAEPEPVSNAASDSENESDSELALSCHDDGSVSLSAGGNSPIQNVENASVQPDADMVFAEMPHRISASASFPDRSASLGEAASSTSESASSSPEPAPALHKPWASLFKNNREPREGYKLEVDPDPTKACTIEIDDVAPISNAWGPTLIGYIAGRFPGRAAILKCCQGWGCKFSIHESGWLLFRFENEEGLNHVLEKGPYFVFQRPLLLKAIPPYFRFDNEELCQVPVWVRLRSLPLELWNARCLSKILSRVGTPLRTDGLTASHDRSSYARALVEINASQDLVREVEIILPNGCTFQQEISYEFVPDYCSKCKSIGHKPSKCKYAPSSAAAPSPAAVPDPAPADPSPAQANAGHSAPSPALAASNSKQQKGMTACSSQTRSKGGLHSLQSLPPNDAELPVLSPQQQELVAPEGALLTAPEVQVPSKSRKGRSAAPSILALPVVESSKGKEVAMTDSKPRTSSRKSSSKPVKIGGSLPPVSS